MEAAFAQRKTAQWRQPRRFRRWCRSHASRKPLQPAHRCPSPQGFPRTTVHLQIVMVIADGHDFFAAKPPQRRPYRQSGSSSSSPGGLTSIMAKSRLSYMVTARPNSAANGTARRDSSASRIGWTLPDNITCAGDLPSRSFPEAARSPETPCFERNTLDGWDRRLFQEPAA